MLSSLVTAQEHGDDFCEISSSWILMVNMGDIYLVLYNPCPNAAPDI